MSTDTNAAGRDPEDHATAADRAESAAWELAAAPHDSADSSTPAASLTTSSADPADEAVQPPHAPTPAPPAPDPAPAPVPPTPGSAPTADPLRRRPQPPTPNRPPTNHARKTTSCWRDQASSAIRSPAPPPTGPACWYG
ncbi:hypothetical protein [Actinomyces sp. 432]|uniref:hypothetical protein n=1 Tax=Actinomyces sp. 432 TaxID=2057798 RepID=UPI00192A262F|nr:hypothetical protein [Actinomyces sp. 432]